MEANPRAPESGILSCLPSGMLAILNLYLNSYVCAYGNGVIWPLLSSCDDARMGCREGRPCAPKESLSIVHERWDVASDQSVIAETYASTFRKRSAHDSPAEFGSPGPQRPAALVGAVPVQSHFNLTGC